jgi:phage baseplate assembly protein W
VSERPYLDFPFRIDGRRRTATTDENEHVRDLIHQVLFTSPGERVNRPDFGCGLKTLVFAPASEALAAATQVLVKGSLQKWLEQEIQVEAVDVQAQEERLVVTVAYVRLETGERVVEEFARVGAVA